MGGNILQVLIQSVMKLQKEIKLAETDGYDRHISKKEMKLNENNRTNSN